MAPSKTYCSIVGAHTHFHTSVHANSAPQSSAFDAGIIEDNQFFFYFFFYNKSERKRRSEGCRPEIKISVGLGKDTNEGSSRVLNWDFMERVSFELQHKSAKGAVRHSVGALPHPPPSHGASQIWDAKLKHVA